jgi:sortase A
MGKNYANLMILTGTMLLAAALFLVLYNVREDRQSNAASVELLHELKQELAKVQTTTQTQATEYTMPEPSGDVFYAQYEEETTTEAVMPTDPTAELDGRYYAGILAIPALNIELPVMQDWSYANLQLAPCRYSGAAASDDLVLAAHNFSSHFGKIQSLNSGDEIIFTDMSGTVYVYEVLQTEVVDGSDIETMLSGADEWDMTLFTCTLSGRSRVTVRAARNSQE